jgi:hypothetical protein
MRKRSDLLSGVHSINAIVIKHKKMQTRKEENKMQEPSNPEGLCIHRKKVLTSRSGLMTWQQRYTYIHGKTLALNNIYHNPSLPQFLKLC